MDYIGPVELMISMGMFANFEQVIIIVGSSYYKYKIILLLWNIE